MEVNNVRRSLLGVLCLGLSFYSAGAAGAEHPGFPRIGSINVGAPQDYHETAYQEQLARVDMSIINMWPGWEKSRGPMETVVRNIKSRNPNSKVFLYIINNERNINSTDTWGELINKAYEAKWWLYPKSGTTTLVKSTFGTSHYILNNTLLGARDSNGELFVEWFPRYMTTALYKPTPSMDGFFTDNVFWRPRVNGDWNRDGTTDDKTNPTVQAWTRQGYRRHFELLKELMPGKYQIGNIADWGHPSATLTELQGVLHGGVIEHILGMPYSPEGMDHAGNINSRGSWAEMMRWYRKTMAAIGEPKLVVFHQDGVPGDYQAFRYGLTSCMMDDAYYAFSDVNKGFNSVVWFDEYNVDLGQALSGPATTAWKSGVYRRDFQNGIALVNPRGNGPVEVDLGEDFRKLTGKQAPTVNNGQVVRKVTLKDRDGIILMRLKGATKPRPPENIRVE